MPRCGSQVPICDLPIRFDTYKGCSHLCKYCFVYKKYDISDIKNDESIEGLRKFISGKRNQETNWCDWDIPLHWGGMSDPFQPIERTRKRSLECLKLLVETQYPFVVSTKGDIIQEEPYASLLEKSNCVLQISLVTPLYDKIEQGAPTYEERMEVIKRLAKRVKRLNVRIQPYVREAKSGLLKDLKRMKEYGVHGITLEAMKFMKKAPGTIRIGGDFVYKDEILKKDFLEIKRAAKKIGLKVYMGENRMRKYGDSLCYCGMDDLEGFKGNSYNLNHLLYAEEAPKATEGMKEEGTSMCFKAATGQDTATTRYLENKSFEEIMDIFKKNKEYLKVMGVKVLNK